MHAWQQKACCLSLPWNRQLLLHPRFLAVGGLKLGGPAPLSAGTTAAKGSVQGMPAPLELLSPPTPPPSICGSIGSIWCEIVPSPTWPPARFPNLPAVAGAAGTATCRLPRFGGLLINLHGGSFRLLQLLIISSQQFAQRGFASPSQYVQQQAHLATTRSEAIITAQVIPQRA